ncbi:MAG: DNA-3-methyladenine glycosylase family protein [Opitutales bacterium]
MKWTDWQILSIENPFTANSLRETLDGGQAFRWSLIEVENIWQGTWGPHLIQLQLDSTQSLQVRRPIENNFTTEQAIRDYLLLDTDWNAIIDQLPWRSDSHLQASIRAFPELRLLNQPFNETLLGFMCSATKQIPQIKIMCANLANELGDKIVPSGPNALPTWKQIAQSSEEFLRSLGLGFRAKNIKRTADLIVQEPNCLETIESLPYEEAKERLVAFPGVGSKIADCTLLFGARKYEAFPVDTWIIKVLKTRYGLEGWSNPQLERFGRIHLGSYAGYAQQFLFAYERSSR